MQPVSPIPADLVLLGAGHAHLQVLRQFAERPEPGVRLTLVSGEAEIACFAMLAGLIRGDYQPEEAQIDLLPLTAAAGCRLILADPIGLDPVGREIAVAGRPPLPYDLLSIDVDGEPAMPQHSAGIGVRPIGRLRQRLVSLAEALPTGGRIAVVGSGTTGTELALALSAGLRGRVRVALVSETAEPLLQAPIRARRIVRAALIDAGVELISGVRALGLADRFLHLSDGSAIEVVEALWATGVVGPGFLARSGLACDAAGRVQVQATLESCSHPGVFAAGDCAALDGNALSGPAPWGLRAEAPLAGNLRRAARGQTLRRWRPRPDTVAILALGGGRAVAWGGGLTIASETVWRLQDWSNRRRIRQYRPPPRQVPDATESHPARTVSGVPGGSSSAPPQPRADMAGEPEGGQDATVPPARADTLSGLEARQDVAMQPPPGQAIVQSIAQLCGVIDDPFLFGQIAALHALSDLHAMGAHAWTALAFATVPNGSGMRADLSAMLRGASEILRAEGCSLLGSHRHEAGELALGFALTGLADPKRLLRKSGLRLGEALVLTKPVGSGIVLAGRRCGQARASWLLAALASLRVSNMRASEILQNHDATACTHISGGGLAGHLLELLRASRVTAVLWPDAVPVLPGALELAALGLASGGAPENLRRLAPAGSHPRSAILADPQVSGGLLAGVPAERAQACLDALRSAGITAAIVGRVVQPAADGAFPLRLAPADGAPAGA